MSETSVTKQSPVTRGVNFVKRNERRILITTTIVSTTLAVTMRSGIKAHNEFLREHGLFDTFYDLAANEA